MTIDNSAKVAPEAPVSDVGVVADASSPSPPDSLRSRILDQAVALFAERGFAATSMREVAEAANCTKPALYYHFDSKQALFTEVIRSATEEIGAIIERHVAGPGTVRERLGRSMGDYFDHVRTNPTALRLLMRAEIHAESGQPDIDFRSARAVMVDTVIKMLAEGVERGEIRADIHLEDAVGALAGVIDHRCFLWVLEGEPIPEDYPDRMLSLLFGGFAP